MKSLANELPSASCISYLDSAGLSDRLLSGEIKQCILAGKPKLHGWVLDAEQNFLEVFNPQR